jgi:hypothetical protein
MAHGRQSTGQKQEVITIPRQRPIETGRPRPAWLKLIGKVFEAWELWEQVSFVLLILAFSFYALYRGWLTMHR